MSGEQIERQPGRWIRPQVAGWDGFPGQDV